MIPPATILILLASLPHVMQGDVQAVAEEIAAVSKSRTEAASLIALAWHETRLDEYVMTNHCDQAPRGLPKCDHGKALGVWQLHQTACPKAWALATPNGGPGDHWRESLHEQARCAISLLRYFGDRGKSHTLTPVHAAFAGYAARGWDWPEAEVRVATVRRLLAKWPAEGRSPR